jgi:hypothetical protein
MEPHLVVPGIFDAELVGQDVGSCVAHGFQEGEMGDGEVEDGWDVGSWNDEEVMEGGGVDVSEGDEVVVLVDDAGGG